MGSVFVVNKNDGSITTVAAGANIGLGMSATYNTYTGGLVCLSRFFFFEVIAIRIAIIIFTTSL